MQTRKMRLVYILILTISFDAFGQNSCGGVNLSPDRNFSLLTTCKDIGDASTEWNYWLTNRNDTILLTTSILHDMPAPIAFWDKASTKLIYEEQTHKKEEIRIYDLNKMKLVSQKEGFIWGHNAKEYFDEANQSLFFFRYSTPNDFKTFDLMSLNIVTEEVKLVRIIKSSGDPYTGTPEIEKMDGVKRELLIRYETDDYHSDHLKVEY